METTLETLSGNEKSSNKMRIKRQHIGGLVLALGIIFYFIKTFTYCIEVGARGHFTSATNEGLMMTAAKIFAKQGLAPSSGLQVYPGFVTEGPFTDILKESFIYTHYLPGPEYLLAIPYALFGTEDVVTQWARLFPAITLFLCLMLFGHIAKTRLFGGDFFPAAILTGIFFLSPAIYQYGVNLSALSWAQSCLFLSMTLGMTAGENKKRDLLLGFVLGFITIYIHFEIVFPVLIAPFVMGLLIGGKKIRTSATLSFAIGIGLFFGFFVHLLQVSSVLGGLKNALIDQLGTAVMRGETRLNVPPREQIIGLLSHEASLNYRLGSLPMLVIGLFFALVFHKSKAQRAMGALILATIFGYLYWLAMPVHAIVHLSWSPRGFTLLFAVFLTLILWIIQERLHRGPLVSQENRLYYQ